MSQPAGERFELADPKGYQDKLAKLLGGRDPIDVLADTPDELAELAAHRSSEFLRRRPFEGKWTPTEIMGHLVDTEWVFGNRIRAILCDEQPTIIGMDQERWVEVQSHGQADFGALLADFTALRQINVQLWRLITPAQLEQVGLHNERGPESLGLVLKMEAGHDLSHIDQMGRYLTSLDEQA
ncbi:MAG: DinB family protein [bacterium]|nr:DinB family protein [bacterium]